MKDLKEIREHPLQDVAAAPLEDNLLVWHVNLRAPGAILGGAVFHLVIEFSENYPAVAPQVNLCTPLPHPNVFPNKYGKDNYICLDMLDAQGAFSTEDQKNRPYTGWSSGYSMLSLLLQLQTFLLDKEAQERMRLANTNAAITAAKMFECKSCPHKRNQIWPPFPSNAELKMRHKLVIKPVWPKVPKRIVASTESAKPQLTSIVLRKSDLEKMKSAQTLSNTTKKSPAPVEDEWFEIKHGKSVKAKASSISMKVMDTAQSKMSASWVGTVNGALVVKIPATIEGMDKVELKPMVKQAQPQLLDDEFRLSPAEVIRAIKESDMDEGAKARKIKNFKKKLSRKRNDKAAEPVEQMQAEVQKPANKPQSPSKADAAPVQNVQVPVVEPPAAEVQVKKLSSPKPKYDAHACLGDLAVLPYELMLHMLEYLSPTDVMGVSSTCTELRSMCNDGFLWRNLFSRQYPASHLTAENMHDWKYVFELEVNRIAQEMVCFHTKNDYEEDVLGVPIEFTINPRTERIDYIYSSMDLLSSEAFFEHKVRKTVWKEEFTNWLPLYITQDHFERAIPYIEKTLLRLSPHWRSQRFVPTMALEVIPKLMNTMIVLISDKGIHASEKAIDGYCQLHRLMIAMIERYPALQRYVNEQIAGFISDESSRHKEVVPSLGDFLPLVSVSNKYNWLSVASAVLTENFDRNVIWVCKQFPELAKIAVEQGSMTKEQWDKAQKVLDTERLNKSYEASHVSQRLIMFHAYFLSHIARPANTPIDVVTYNYDRYYGKPSWATKKKFQQFIKRVSTVTKWPQFFQCLGLKYFGDESMIERLKLAVKNSLRKRYHKNNTDFTRIQASGVSKILLRGESYTASPTLQSVLLEEVWHYPEGTIFLDASCLCYNSQGKFVEVLDWCHKASGPAGTGAVTHSGDVIDHPKKEGKHTINIDLSKLKPEITSMFFTISAYTTTLKEIRQPYIRFTDKVTNMELCRYQLDEKAGNYTAVVMCKLYRKNAGDKQWHVDAIGQLGEGRASDYAPIHKQIDNLLKKK
jgi:stress response protein SCP2/ubiquitin-protein ligase